MEQKGRETEAARIDNVGYQREEVHTDREFQKITDGPIWVFSRHIKKLQEAQEEKPERIIGNTDLISYLSENGDNFHHSELKPTQFMRQWT